MLVLSTSVEDLAARLTVAKIINLRAFNSLRKRRHPDSHYALPANFEIGSSVYRLVEIDRFLVGYLISFTYELA